MRSLYTPAGAMAVVGRTTKQVMSPLANPGGANIVPIPPVPTYSLALNPSATNAVVYSSGTPARTNGQPVTWGCSAKIIGTTGQICGFRAGNQLGKIGIAGGGVIVMDYDSVSGNGQAISPVVLTDYRDDQWHAIVARYDGMFITLWVDGAVTAMSGLRPTASCSATNFSYGRRTDSPSEFANINVALGFHCTSAWSDADIASFASTKSYPVGPTYTFKHLFDEGSGTTAFDTGGGTPVYNAAITNGIWVSGRP